MFGSLSRRTHCTNVFSVFSLSFIIWFGQLKVNCAQLMTWPQVLVMLYGSERNLRHFFVYATVLKFYV